MDSLSNLGETNPFRVGLGLDKTQHPNFMKQKLIVTYEVELYEAADPNAQYESFKEEAMALDFDYGEITGVDIEEAPKHENQNSLHTNSESAN